MKETHNENSSVFYDISMVYFSVWQNPASLMFEERFKLHLNDIWRFESPLPIRISDSNNSVDRQLTVFGRISQTVDGLELKARML